MNSAICLDVCNFCFINSKLFCFCFFPGKRHLKIPGEDPSKYICLFDCYDYDNCYEAGWSVIGDFCPSCMPKLFLALLNSS